MIVCAALAALALAGCGSSSSSSSGSPLNTELSYFPAGAPAVAVFATNPNGTAWQNASGFVAKFPLAKLGLEALQSDMTKSGVNYNQDIKPLLGNPVAFGVPTTTSASGNDFVIVLVATSASKLSVLTSSQPAPRSIGNYQGAKLYQGNSYCLAINGATALLAPTVADIKSALDLHAHGGGISSSDYNKAFTGLPQNTLIQVYGNLTGILSRPQAAQARQIPWVGAINSYAVTVGVADTGIDVHYRVNTTGAGLTSNELPLTTGSTPPSVAGTAPAVVGFRDLAQLFTFAEGAVQAVNPKALAAFEQNAAKDGISLNRDLIAQFTGNSELDYGPGGVTARADLANPTVAARTIAKFKNLKPIGGGFYQSKTSSKPVRLGIADGRLVLGDASVAALRSFAAAPASPISAASGPLAQRVTPTALLTLIEDASHSASSLPPQAAQLLGAFGDLVSWSANDTSGLHGELSLPLK
jgi:Protein of unknown function (DUF3352)